MDVMTILFQQDGHTGLEIAPGKDIDNKDLIEDIGNIWNGVPVAREWFALVREQPLCSFIAVIITTANNCLRIAYVNQVCYTCCAAHTPCV